MSIESGMGRSTLLAGFAVASGLQDGLSRDFPGGFTAKTRSMISDHRSI
jgi:hypothetical protein